MSNKVNSTMQQQIIEWLANGETGLSSEVMAFKIGFDVIKKGKHYPHDVSDLGRCMRLIEAAPQMSIHIQKMKDVSPIWANLSQHWHELTSLYYEEGDKKPKTYALLQKLIKDNPNVIRVGNMIIKHE